MQQFQVPQFITVEDKIIGPFTLKQFLYVLGAIATVVLTFTLFHFILFVLIGVPVAGFFLAMAFATINGQSFPVVFMNGINYYFKPHLYLWQQGKGSGKPNTSKAPMATPEAALLNEIPKLSESKLSDLAWSLDINKKIERS